MKVMRQEGEKKFKKKFLSEISDERELHTTRKRKEKKKKRKKKSSF
jgi:hypothetical protein